tara:strand:+ start:330 stop:1349 length:1020 start_codon:yes stop_codon:yes gene_type:complete
MVEIDDDEPTGETEDESVAVTTEPDQGWRTADGFVAYDNYHQAFVHEDGKPRVIIIIDNHERHSGVPFPNNKHYFVVVPDWEFWRITPLCIELSELKITNDGSYELFIESLSTATLWPPINSVLLDDDWYGVPLYVPDPNVDHARPVTEVTKTTSAVTGNTVETTVVTDPKAAGAVTTSETKVGTGSPKNIDDVKVAATVTPASLKAEAANLGTGKPDTKVVEKLEPCIPNVPPANQVAKGAGSAPKVKGPDDVIAAARKRAAERANVNPNVSDGTANPGPAAETTKPQLVTQDTTVNPVNGKPSSEASVTEGVYAYKPMRTGFDRYDFNSGKKLFTSP